MCWETSRKALLRIERSKEDAQGYEPYVPINDEDADISVIAVLVSLIILGMASGSLETEFSVTCPRSSPGPEEVTDNPGAFEGSTQHHLIFLSKRAV
jgi:hypothetical protein